VNAPTVADVLRRATERVRWVYCVAQCPHCGGPAHVHYCLKAPDCAQPSCACRIHVAALLAAADAAERGA
jgi:hypothetical protein